MGTIKFISKDVTNMLGYHQKELKGLNISTIMPSGLADVHDSLMKGYFSSSRTSVLSLTRSVFPLDKHGYMVPSEILIKMLPDLDNGARGVGLLRELNKSYSSNDDDEYGREHFVMFEGQNGRVYGVDFHCKQDFGIPSYLCWGRDDY